MNDYERRRDEKIKRNQALLAELDIKSSIPSRPSRDSTKDGPPAKKRRKLAAPAPSRTSARIASSQAAPPQYNEDVLTAEPRQPRKFTKHTKSPPTTNNPLPPAPPKDIASLQTKWTSWTPTAPTPTVRDPSTGTYVFPDHPDFTPNLSPFDILRQGAFGGSYYRPLFSAHLRATITEDYKADLLPDWLANLDVNRYLLQHTYDPKVNKFAVQCGQSIEEWEAAGWIAHEWDVRGWCQWYIRFWRGRRTDDGEDERQIGRWKRCVGNKGRWKRLLLRKYVQMGVGDVMDYGEGDEGVEVSPVMHQTCHHWGYEVRQADLDAFWKEVGR